MVHTADGKTHRINANWLHNNDLDHWQGWRCNAGHQRISIDENFDVYSGECMNDQLGNLFGSWDLLPAAGTCRRQTCTGCTDDLVIKKYKP
jgi:hypothetical protein